MTKRQAVKSLTLLLHYSSLQYFFTQLRFFKSKNLVNRTCVFSVHSEDIRKIVSRAQGDLTIEQMLKRFEEIWLGKVFTMKEHVKSSMEQKDFLDAPDDDAFVCTLQSFSRIL